MDEGVNKGTPQLQLSSHCSGQRATSNSLAGQHRPFFPHRNVVVVAARAPSPGGDS